MFTNITNSIPLNNLNRIYKYDRLFWSLQAYKWQKKFVNTIMQVITALTQSQSTYCSMGLIYCVAWALNLGTVTIILRDGLFLYLPRFKAQKEGEDHLGPAKATGSGLLVSWFLARMETSWAFRGRSGSSDPEHRLSDPVKGKLCSGPLRLFTPRPFT